MEKTIKSLKQAQADVNGLYIKLHTYHWNVKGIDFNIMNSHIKKTYNNIAILYDNVLERIILLSGKPYSTVSELAQNCKIQEEKKDLFYSKEILKSMVNDIIYLIDCFIETRDIAKESGDSTTVAFADEQITHLEKELWILNRMKK